jgi:hypothetical protein
MMIRHVLAGALLASLAPAMAGNYVPVAPIRVAPMVHVAPVVHVNPAIRVNPTVKPVVVGHPADHVHHHPLPQPVVVYTASRKPKCAESKPGSKECAQK